MSTTLTIGGVLMDVPGTILPRQFRPYVAEGIPTFSFEVRGGALPGLPDPYAGKELILTVGGVRVFVGDVMRHDPNPGGLGWIRQYTAFGLRHRGDWVPFTDDTTGLDTAAFNLPNVTDPGYIASRAGRTVGQILTTCLTMMGNAAALTQYGIGNYGGTATAPTLPAATVADLAAMTIIPPAAVYVSGEKLLGAIEAFLANWAPNTCLWVDPRDGTLRFLDKRTAFTPHTLTLGVDPVELPPLSRDLSHCAPRVLVRGQPMVMPVLASLSNGLLEEDFGHDGLSNSAAKAAWSPSDFNTSGTAQDSGTCTCPSTTTVTVTSSNTGRTWVSDHWDQTNTGAHGWIHLLDPLLTNQLTAVWATPIIANTAMTAGGPSTLTVQNALPVTSFSQYTIFGFTGGSSIVWRKYHITNSAIAAALATAFMADVPFVLASGDGATLTSTPLGSVVYGTAPYQEQTLSFTQDPATGTIVFFAPTWTLAGNKAPHDVRALLAVNVRSNQVVKPDTGFEGTSHTEDGLTNTLTITVDQWRDPGQAANLQAYAQDVLDSVKDAIVEGTIVYRGLYSAALLMGHAFQIAAPYVTGWEGLTLPCLEMTLEWPQGTGSQFVTHLHVSNRRAAYSAAAFLKPDRTGMQIISGNEDDLKAFSAGMVGIGTSLGDIGMNALSGQFGAMNETIAQQGGAYAGEQIAASNDAIASQISAANDPSQYLPGDAQWAALGASMDPSSVMPGAGAFAALGLDDPNFQLPSNAEQRAQRSVTPEAVQDAAINKGKPGESAPGFSDVGNDPSLYD